MALPTFCSRCYWYRLNCRNPPYSVFPAIFNDIDLYTKRIVHAYMDKHGHPPDWMGAFSTAQGYADPGLLKLEDHETGILLTGAVDDLLHADERSRWFLLDYKTARYTNGQDRLLPLYKAQLLAYAYLLAKTGYAEPEISGLIYFEPPSEPTIDDLLNCTEESGFVLPLSANVIPVELEDFRRLRSFLRKSREIYDQDKDPKEGREGCPDCKKLDFLISVAARDAHAGKQQDWRWVRDNFGVLAPVLSWVDIPPT